MVHSKKFQPPRVTLQGLVIIKAFMDNPQRERCGAELIKNTGFSSGTIYPLLLRFEKAHVLESKWEDVEPEIIGRPRRRLYKITPNGLAWAQRELKAIWTGNLWNPVPSEI